MKTGDIIPFGKYEWRVLDVQNGKALLLSEKIIEQRAYHDPFASSPPLSDEITWETCTLRGYLNGKFYNSFSEEDKARIIETTIKNPDNLWYGTIGGNDTRDKIFLLSIEEADRYFGNSGDYLKKRRKNFGYNPRREEFYCFKDAGGAYITNKYDNDRVAEGYDDRDIEPCDTPPPGGRAHGGVKPGWRPVKWALRSHGEPDSFDDGEPGGYSDMVAHVESDGKINVGGSGVTVSLADGVGVRPALWLSLE